MLRYERRQEWKELAPTVEGYFGRPLGSDTGLPFPP